MRKIFFVLILFSSTIYSQKYYGSKINFNKISEFSDVKNNLNKNIIQLEGEILSSCPKKGCWMEMKFDNDTVFIKFKDYGFFVPKNDIEGKIASINGILSSEIISVKELRHYAEDAGKSKLEISEIKNPKLKFSFVADGVKIYD
tara:strand:- start:201 stop:632 length:432 start_codon:yes stop_codon:yes gene_type:complete